MDLPTEGKKLQEMVQEGNEITPLYYYDDGVSVCLILTPKGEVLSRGVAICSTRDQFVRKTGRNMALGRAIQVLCHKKDLGHINWERFGFGTKMQETMWRVVDVYGRKGAYQPHLTDMERELVARCFNREKL